MWIRRPPSSNPSLRSVSSPGRRPEVTGVRDDRPWGRDSCAATATYLRANTSVVAREHISIARQDIPSKDLSALMQHLKRNATAKSIKDRAVSTERCEQGPEDESARTTVPAILHLIARVVMVAANPHKTPYCGGSGAARGVWGFCEWGFCGWWCFCAAADGLTHISMSEVLTRKELLTARHDDS
jgi:hypothetical protein